MANGKLTKDRQYDGQRKLTKGKTVIYKTLHKRLEQHELCKEQGMNSGAPGVGVRRFSYTSDTPRFPVIREEHHLILKSCRTPVQIND
jgi:hypothetical protein